MKQRNLDFHNNYEALLANVFIDLIISIQVNKINGMLSKKVKGHTKASIRSNLRGPITNR